MIRPSGRALDDGDRSAPASVASRIEPIYSEMPFRSTFDYRTRGEVERELNSRKQEA